MFYEGFSVGCIVMALVAICAYEWFLRQERDRRTLAEKDSQHWYELYNGLADRFRDECARAYARGAENQRHITEISDEERSHQDARDS